MVQVDQLFPRSNSIWGNIGYIYLYIYIYMGKLQITLLKFGDVWILQFEVLEFEFYPLKFGSVWILHHNVLEFGFYALNFKGVEVLLP